MMSASSFRIAAAVTLLAAAAGAQSADVASADLLAGSSTTFGTLSQPSAPGSYSALLYDNGGLITNAGAGFGGADASAIETPGTAFGFNINNVAAGGGFRCADDFTVPAGPSWTLTNLKTYSYQTGSTTTSTYTGAFVQIWSGAAGPLGGATLLAGDTTTNRLLGSTFSNIYRVTTTTLTANTRPLMELDIDMSWAPALPPGTYWVDIGLTGSLASGPWMPPVTPRPATLNGQQWQLTLWASILDGTVGAELPFRLEGSACSGPLSAANSTPGALIPALGSGGTGSTWPTTLPADPTSLSVTTTCPITCIDSITINNPTHSWAGDTHFVLVDPGGVAHNLLVRPGFTGAGFGNSGDFTGGSLVLVDPTTLGAATIPTTGNIAAGTYKQSFGAGTAAGTVNTPLRLISGPAGTWTLKVYDWAGGDTGALDGFTIDANTCNLPTTVYCVAKINSLGCTPAIAATGTPSASAGSGFVISASNIRNNKNGLLVYGNNGSTNQPFQGGTLCVNPPTRRAPYQNSFGSGPALPPDCTGTFAIDMNTFAVGGLGGTPAPFLTSVGAVVNCQWWSRDPGFPAPNNSNTTDAVQYYVGS